MNFEGLIHFLAVVASIIMITIHIPEGAWEIVGPWVAVFFYSLGNTLRSTSWV